MSIFLDYLKEHEELIKNLSSLDENLQIVSDCFVSSIKSGNKILVCGNGGSASDAQHFASELTGRFIDDRIPLPAVSLATDSSALTCISNDFSFDHVFSRQIEAIGTEGDCLMCISTSGISNNLILAAKSAKKNNIKCVGLLGKGGGPLNELCDYSIIVPSDSTARIQEAHILIYHSICRQIELDLGLV